MSDSNINDRLKQLSIEDKIWVIYIGIIFLSWYSNIFERDYFINKSIRSKDKYRTINIIIFMILVVVYYYFLNSSLEDIKKLRQTDSQKKKTLVYLSYIGSLLIFISGIIFLYISLVDDNLDIEVAFN